MPIFMKKRIDYIEALLDFANHDFEKAFLLSAGTEATEAALKLMRLYGQSEQKQSLGILCIDGNWHGRTLGAQMMSSNQAQKAWIGYHDPNIHHIPFPYPWVCKEEDGALFFEESIQKLEHQGFNFSTDLCGVMLETFQGWGAIFYPKSYVKAVKEFCLKYNILLTFDEMQAGFGRTGKPFGYQHYDVQPDLICIGKGMASGLPLSGVLGSNKVMDLPEVGNMSSTHSANPICCAAGLATIQELNDKNLIYESKRKGAILHQGLNDLKNEFPDIIQYVFGEGLIASLIIKDPFLNDDHLLTSKIVEECFCNGLLLVHTGRESIKIGPPLIISDGALIEGIQVIRNAIHHVIK